MAGRFGGRSNQFAKVLWEHAKMPAEVRQRGGIDAWLNADRDEVVRDVSSWRTGRIRPSPITSSCWSRVAGHPTNSYWMEGYSPHVVGRRVEVPKDFMRPVRAS